MRFLSCLSKAVLVVTVVSIAPFTVTSVHAGDDFRIDEAKWDDEKSRLTVKGKGDKRNTVTVFNADTDTYIGEQYISDDEWRIRVNLAVSPCRVRAEQSNGEVDFKDVKEAPSDCDNGGGVNAPPVANDDSYNATTAIQLVVAAPGVLGNDSDDGQIAPLSANLVSDVSNGVLNLNPDGSFEYLANTGFTGNDVFTYVADDGQFQSMANVTINVQSTPTVADVSINSTSQSCNSADISGNDVVCNQTPVPEQPYVGNIADHAIVAINDLGMHCGDLDTRISSILPPFQVLLAQVIQKGAEPSLLQPGEIDVFYSAVSNANDPILGDNTVFRGLTADGSVYKTNFWDFPLPAGTYDVFYPAYNPFVGASAPLVPLAGPPFNISHDVSLPVPNVEDLYIGHDGIVNSGDEFLAAALQDMPGIDAPYASAISLSNEPQHVEEYLGDKPFFINFPFGYVANDVNWFEGAGIPLAAYDDAGRENAYPLVRVEARTTGGTTLATVDTVLPISGEASCKNCHADPMDPNFGGSRTSGPSDVLADTGLPVVNSDEDPMLLAGTVPVDVAVEWATDINVLRLHDNKHGANYVSSCDAAPCASDPCVIDAANPNGSASCLTNQALVQQKPVICQTCHYTPALDLAQLGPLAGDPGTVANGRNQLAHQSNSRVMHNHHGQFTDLFPAIDPPVQDGIGGISNQATRLAQLEESCYQCHPGTNVQCLRGAMFDGGMLCNDCHGDMEQVGADFTAGVSPHNPGAFQLGLGNYYEPDSAQPRVPWANEPGCGSCHTGDYNDNLAQQPNVMTNLADALGNQDGIRLRQAWRIGDARATPIVPTNTRFAENSIPASFNGFANPGAGTINTNDAADGAANPKLYRVSTGHGGIFCEGCHGATHAEFDSDAPSLSNDDVTAQQLQGHAGTIVECTTCHADEMNSQITLDGPHGMHPVGANTRFADGGHEDLAKSNPQACQACHGSGDYEDSQALGTVLSLAKADRDFRGLERGGVVARGEPIGCATCHN